MPSAEVGERLDHRGVRPCTLHRRGGAVTGPPSHFVRHPAHLGEQRRLADAGRAEEVGGRHARHQVAWIERADRRLMAPGSPSVAEIGAALPELRAALADAAGKAARLVAVLRQGKKEKKVLSTVLSNLKQLNLGGTS